MDAIDSRLDLIKQSGCNEKFVRFAKADSLLAVFNSLLMPQPATFLCYPAKSLHRPEFRGVEIKYDPIYESKDELVGWIVYYFWTKEDPTNFLNSQISEVDTKLHRWGLSDNSMATQ